MNNKQLRDVSKRISSYSLPRRKETKEFTGFKYIHYGDIHTKVANIINEDDNLPNIEVGQYEVLQKYDIVVADASEDYQGIGQPAIVLFEPTNNIVAGLHTYAIRPDLKKVDALYLFYLIKSQKFKRYGYKVGTGMKVFGINVDNFMNFSHTYPSKEKQTQIGDFFKNLDELIELHQATIYNLKEIKKGFVQKLFVSYKSKKPDMRIKNFNENWNKTQLGKEVSISRGLTYGPKDVADKGIKVLRSSNIYKGSIIENEDDIFVNHNAVNRGLVKEGDILVTAANGSPHLVGKHAVLPKFTNDAVHGGFMLLIESNYPHFINNWMYSTDYLKMLMTTQGGGGAISNLSQKMLEEVIMRVPEIEEQRLLGRFFKQIDELISLEKIELELLQEMKKGFLQKMFV